LVDGISNGKKGEHTQEIVLDPQIKIGILKLFLYPFLDNESGNLIYFQYRAKKNLKTALKEPGGE
jgi:hypothetical protein